jgi:CHAT domain-containing protein/TPR repeat protein
MKYFTGYPRSCQLVLVTAILLVPTCASAQNLSCTLWPTRASDRFTLLPEQDRSSRAQALVDSCSQPRATAPEQLARAAALVHLHRFDEAESILRQLVPLNDAGPAKLLADVLTGRNDRRDSQFEEATRLYEPLAEAGDTEAGEGLALALWNRVSVGEDDRIRAIALLNAADAAGSPSAAMRLGILLTRDMGPRFPIGLAALERAVAKENVRAHVVLADFVARGVGVEKNEERAAALLEQAAREGDGEAQHRLGRMWEEGWTVRSPYKWNHDIERALALYRQGAAQGYVPAMLELGTVLGFGLQHELEPKTGHGALANAIEHGSIEASERLGLLYELGIGVPVDLDKARALYGTAARTYWRPNVALTRLNAANIAAWAAEEKRFRALEFPIGTPAEEGSNARHFLREKPSDLSFEPLEGLTLTLYDESGRSVFRERLQPGDTVNLDPARREFLSIDAGGGTGRQVAVLHMAGRELPIMASAQEYTKQIVLAMRDDILLPAKLPELAGSGVFVRAFAGPGDGVEIHDPEFQFERRGLQSYPPPPWSSDTSARLESTTEVEIPDLPVVEMRIVAESDFAIAAGAEPLVRMQVPREAVLYLRLPKELLRGPYTVAAFSDIEPLRLEFDYDQGKRDTVVLLSQGVPVGWLYKAYVPKSDGVIAAFVPMVFESYATTKTLLPDWDAVYRLSRADAFMKIRDYGRQSIEFLSALKMSARALSGQGRTEDAIEAFDRVISSSRMALGARSELYAGSLLDLAGLYQARGDLSRALALARRGLAIYGTLPRRYSDRRYTSTLTTAQVPLSRGEAHQGYQVALRSLAALFDQAGRYDLALLYRYQLAAFDTLADPRATNIGADDYVAIEDFELRRGNTEGARKAAEIALWIAKGNFGYPGFSDPLPSPITQPSGFDRLFGPIDRSVAASMSLRLIGDAYVMAGRPMHYAEPLYAAALTAAMNTTGAGSSAALHAAAGLARTRSQTTRDSEAVAMLRDASGYNDASGTFPPFLSVDRDARLLFFDAYLAALHRANSDPAELARSAAAVFLAEENEDLAHSFDLSRNRLRTSDDRLRRVLDEWIAAKSNFEGLSRRLLTSAATTIPSREDALRRESDTARRRLLDAEREIKAAFPDRIIVGEPKAGLARVQSLLAPDEAIIVLLPLRETVAALLITREFFTVSSTPTSDFELANEITAFRRALDPAALKQVGHGDPFASIDLAPLIALREATIGPFITTAGNKRRLIVIPHGFLRNIPLEAIPLDAASAKLPTAQVNNVKWAGIEYDIAYLPSLSALVDLRSNFPSSKATQPFAAVADPILAGDPRLWIGTVQQTLRNLRDRARRWSPNIAFLNGSELAPIPETQALVEKLRLILDGRTADVFTGMRASRRDILTSTALQTARVIAFATHGLTADEDTAKSGEPLLVLTSTENPGAVDGLTASEISQLNLDAELVLLSACSTAAPNGEPGGQGFSGLAQAFLAAGARSIIVTHWMVRSRAAEIFSIETFGQAAQRGLSPGEAVRLGRQKVMARLPHPAFWAGFIFVGDPSRRWALR